MEPEDLYRVWAHPGGLWSDWVAPALFAQILYAEPDAAIEDEDFSWFPPSVPDRVAIVLDLPGARSVRLGVHLAMTRGFRPVPAINTSPGPSEFSSGSKLCVVDMRALIQALFASTPCVQALRLPDDAPPVFLLDNARTLGTSSADEGMFDNRWMVFPQDFPSGAFLKNHGIEAVLLLQEHDAPPQEDLCHVLLRWQEAGIRIIGRDGGPIRVSRPSRFRALWYRALAIMGLRRNSAGGFGSYVPESRSAG
jgi:hypothetical protein